jgi:RpiB/LacA/LacB family sugar-phosphate isomerase
MADGKKIYFGCDHAGFPMKKPLLDALRTEFPQLIFEDCGTLDESSVDYPDFAKAVAMKVVAESARGILVCGSGAGMAMAANKVAGIRASQAWDATSARLCRQHNDANVLCFGARLVGLEVALDIVRVWLNTEFLGGRHQRRIDKIKMLEGGTA